MEKVTGTARTPAGKALIDVEPAYQCGECGAVWLKSQASGQANRCEDCGKMGSKVTDSAFACPGCDSIFDAETMEEIE